MSEITKIKPKNDTFTELQRKANALFQSGFFKDVQSQAQAIAKVMAGDELGIPAFSSIAGIHIVQGKPVLGANLIATLIGKHPEYDYRVITQEDKENERCDIEFYKSGVKIGKCSFTLEEAKIAGISGKDNWKKYPSDMCFARAISRGARRFTPAIFGGAPIYTPEELNVEVDEDGYIDAKYIESTMMHPKEQEIDYVKDKA